MKNARHTHRNTHIHRHTDTESCLVPALSDGPKVEIAMPETLNNLNEEHGERGYTGRKNPVKTEDMPLKCLKNINILIKGKYV